MKSWLQDNVVVMYSNHNAGKSVAAERFITTLKNKIYKYMTSISENVYTDKLDDREVDDHERISKYKNIFAKGYTPNWSEEIFVIKEIKNTVPWTYVINEFNGDEIIGTFYKKELQKIDQQEFRIEKLIKKKGNKLCVK